MKLRLIEDDKDLSILENNWEKLASYAFHDFDWVYKYWQNIKNDNLHFKALVVEDNSEIIGFTVFCIDNGKTLKHVPFKKLYPLGERFSDTSDIFVKQDENREQVFKIMFDYILKNFSFDYLEFDYLNDARPNYDLWKKYTSLYGFDLEYRNKYPRINLSKFNSYEEYFQQLGKKHKGSISNRLNRLKKESTSFEFVFKKNITEDDIDKIAELNLKRQKYLYGKGHLDRFCHFTNEKIMNFIKEYFCSNQNDNKLLSYLTFDNKIIAYTLITENNNNLYCWNGTFDQDYERYSPSNLIANEQIKYAFENKYNYFDFLSGDEPYKLFWTNESSSNYDLKVNKSNKAKFMFWLRKSMVEVRKKKTSCKNVDFIKIS